jgi:uncharacterized membrane protein
MLCHAGCQPPAGLSAARGFGRLQHVFMVVLVTIVIIFFNIVPLIMEFTTSDFIEIEFLLSAAAAATQVSTWGDS